MQNSKSLLYIKLIGSVTFWGATWIAGRILAGDLTAYSAAFLRFFFATICMYFLIITKTGQNPKCEVRDILPLCFLGITGVALYNILFFTGLKSIEAGRAALIISATPTLIAVSSAFIFKERLTIQKTIGLIAAIIGVSFILGHGNPLDLFTQGIGMGDLCIVGCSISWTAYSLAGKPVMKRVSPLNSVFWSCFFGAIMLLIPALMHGLVFEIPNISMIDFICIIFLALFGTSLSFSWYCEAIQKIGPAKTGIFINLVPVMAIIMGILILGEKIEPALVIGGSLTIFGVWITNRS